MEDFETSTSLVDSENTKHCKIVELAFVYFLSGFIPDIFFLSDNGTEFKDSICTELCRILKDAFIECIGKQESHTTYFPLGIFQGLK